MISVLIAGRFSEDVDLPTVEVDQPYFRYNSLRVTRNFIGSIPL
jgi:hypothetical protein